MTRTCVVDFYGGTLEHNNAIALISEHALAASNERHHLMETFSCINETMGHGKIYRSSTPTVAAALFYFILRSLEHNFNFSRHATTKESSHQFPQAN